ncbi:MFS transporter [Shimazuella sp. AN120528]|uniref:MFS transporter n=1 Tax=Shimazuella soli TaxID=1892854 RepID=UPI001F0F6823|nr:MFS transporter [Shimazuella soli]MCH5584714.1 MFS transporter [Shimazuella soli]
MENKLPSQTEMKLMRVLMFTLTFSAMSALMFNFVLPQLREEFHLTTAQVSWVTSCYSLIYGIGTAIYGKLADRFQLKNLLTFGLITFALGCLAGFASQAFWMVLLGRCMQALGAGTIPATAMLIPLRYFPAERRGSAMGMAFVGLALGSAIGPVISALIVSKFNWRWLFIIPLLILFTLPAYRKYLIEEKQTTFGKFDGVGGTLLAASVSLILLGITGAWGYLLGGFLSLALFIIRIKVTAEPFVQPKIFKNKTYTLGLMIAFLINGIGTSLYFLSPLFLSDVHHLSSSWTGFAMVPAAVASAILGTFGGKLADKKGNPYLFIISSLLLISCFLLLSTFSGISPIFLALFLILGNVGQTFIMIAISNSIVMTLPKEQAGIGMGLVGMLNFIAGGMASGIYGKLIDFNANVQWNPFNHYASGFIYSNIFFVLAILYIGILLLYYFQFVKERTIQSSKSII